MTKLPVPRPTSRTLSRLATLVLGLVGLLGATEAEAASNPARQALDEFYGKKAEPNVIQNKFFLKANRFEIAPALGYVPNNAFVSNPYGGAVLAYHFSESFSAEGMFLYAPNTGNAGVKGLTETLVDIAYDSNPETNFRQPLDRLQLGALFSARWAPIYGKINLIGEGVANFDMYGTGGVGLLMISKDHAELNPEWGIDDTVTSPVIVDPQAPMVATPALNLGIGLNFFVTQSIAIKLDARSAIYVADEPDYGNVDANGNPAELDKRLYNTFLTTAGVSVFVPRMKPRMFNF